MSATRLELIMVARSRALRRLRRPRRQHDPRLTSTWTVESDERWVILGPNGAGKTTLLQIASASIHPISGTARCSANARQGRRLRAAPAHRLRLDARWPAASPPNETVLDVVLTAAYSVTGRWNEEYEDVDVRRAHRVLDGVEARPPRGPPFGTLSDGEQKRVQIARAVMTDPELLLLDEPAASLDLGAREELLQLLGGYAATAEAPAMVMVTHHVEEIPPGFTHALLLADGRMHAAGPIDEVITGERLSRGLRARRWSSRRAKTAGSRPAPQS